MNKKLNKLQTYKPKIMAAYWNSASIEKRKELLEIVEVEERFIDKYAELHKMEELPGKIRVALLHKFLYKWKFMDSKDLYITIPKKRTESVRKYSITPETRRAAIIKADITRAKNKRLRDIKKAAIKAKAAELEAIMNPKAKVKTMGKGLKVIKKQHVSKPRYTHKKKIEGPIKPGVIKVKAKPSKKIQPRKEMYKEFRKTYKADKQAAVQKQKDLNKKQVLDLKTKLTQERNTSKKLRTLINNFIEDTKKLVG